MIYFWVKLLHILSSTLVLGTGLGIAFFMWMAHLKGNPQEIAATGRIVVIADSCFTAPAVVTQLVTGVWLMHLMGLTLETFWIRTALLLFVLTGVCWLPVLWLQIRARNLARNAAQNGTALPGSYYRCMRTWFILGWPAFIAVLLTFMLMVVKPANFAL